MSLNNKEYKIHIFKKAINKYLDKILPFREQDALNALSHQMDDIVWKIATTIYMESGYKIDFSLIRDIANSRIDNLKNTIAAQKVEEAKLKAEIEAKQNQGTVLKKKRKDLKIDEKEYFMEFIGNTYMYDVYTKIKKILVNELEIESNSVDLDSRYCKRFRSRRS